MTEEVYSHFIVSSTGEIYQENSKAGEKVFIVTCSGSSMLLICDIILLNILLFQ